MKADLDDGYMRIANTLAIAECQLKLSGCQHQVYSAIKYKTFGFNKSMDWISGVQISDLCGIARSRVSEALKVLVERQIVIKEGRAIGINTLVSEWKAAGDSNAKDSAKLEQKLRKSVTKKVTQIRNKDSAKPEQQLRKPVTKGSAKPEPHKTQDTSTKNNTTKNKLLDLADLPVWLPVQEMADFIEHRKTLRKPMSQKAVTLLINKVSELRDAGYDPITLLNTAVERGWMTVFEPKEPPEKPLVVVNQPLPQAGLPDKVEKRERITAAVMDVRNTDW